MIKKRNNSNSLHDKGFTLVELLLAMTIFVTVTVISTVGFIGMNRVFIRGLVRKALSEAVQRVTEDTTKIVRASSVTIGADQPVAVDGTDFQQLCFGTVRYIWKPSSVSSAEYGLFKQSLPSTGCSSTNTDSNREQLIEGRFVVDELNVTPVQNSDDLVMVQGVIRTTDSAAFNFTESKQPNDPNYDPTKLICKGSAQNAAVRTCALEKFKFIVSSRNIGVSE